MPRRPSQPTIKRLFAVSGNRCAFQDCSNPLIEPTSGKVTGRICHIKAQSANGPRYEKSQTNDERHGFDNLILMCPIHHDVIDDDEETYTVEFLQDLKTKHEARYAGGREPSDHIVRQLLYPPYTAPPLPGPDELPEPGSLPPGSWLPFHRNALFTGRVGPLKALAGRLLHGGAASTLITQAVAGMGGVGKTQLAVEFAYRYGRYFQGVHWLNAAQPESLDAEVARCGAEMGLSPWPAEQPEQVKLTLRAWQNDAPRLVILDNLKDGVAASRWLLRLRNSGARVLLTARRTDWPRHLGLNPLPLEMFSPEESLAFLREYLPPERASDEELEELAERLGHLPLALELAGRYLECLSRLDVPAYLQKLAGLMAHPSMAGWRGDLGNPTGHDLDLAATFALSWDREDITPPSRRLFRIAGYCAPNQPIPCDLLEQAAHLDEEGCDDALGLLVGLGLLRMENPQAGPTIHPLMAEYARLVAAEDETEDALTAVAAALGTVTYDALESQLPERFAPLRPHLEVSATHAEAAKLEKAGTLWSNLGAHLSDVANHQRAKVVLERALAIDEAAFGPNHPNVATDVNNLGRVLLDLGDHAGARDAFERALAIDEAVFGPDHPTVATDVNHLGLVLQALGDYAGAREAFERALAIQKQALGENHPGTATTLHDLGTLLRSQGDYAGARIYLERALAVYEHVFGEQHPWVATAINNLGNVLQELGDDAGARAAYERALAIWQDSYGKEHPQVAMGHNNLGMVLRVLGDHAGARAALERALPILEQVLGPDHPNVATLVNNLGNVLQDLGDHAGARAAYERALAIDEAAFGPDHPKVATDVNNLGLLLWAQGDLAGAQAAFERALGILEQSLPPEHLYIADLRAKLAALNDLSSPPSDPKS